MIPPSPPKSGAFGRDVHDSATFANFLTAVNTGASDCQFSVSGSSIAINSPTANTPSFIFSNSATSGQGGEVIQIKSSLAATTGSLPFVFFAVDFNVNDDTSRDFNVGFGHGFDGSGALVSGATWGACGLVFEQHYNPNAGVNQSETYFRIWNLQGTQFRPFSITHANHDKNDGTDTILAATSGHSYTIYAPNGTTTRATFDSNGLGVVGAFGAVGSRGSEVFKVISTGAINSTAPQNYFNPTLDENDETVFYLQPTLNLSSETTAGVYLIPSYTSLTNSSFHGWRDYLLPNKAMNTLLGSYHNVGVNGAVTVLEAAGSRVNFQSYTGTVTDGYGYHVLTPTVTGALTNFYAFKADDCTGYYAWRSGTGKHAIGSNSANSLVGFWGATPVAQYSTTGTTTGFTAGSGTAVKDDSTFTGNTGTKAYTIGDVVRALKLLGIIASS